MFRKQQKNQSKLSKRDDEDTGPQELLERPKEYIVRLDYKLQPSIFLSSGCMHREKNMKL